MTNIRVRFAPSPTGSPHIGNIRTAIYDWLLAKHTGGTFILRIEDTDRARYVPGSLEEILESLRWLGLMWNEGPEVGGSYGPYLQSERLDIYAKYARQLLDEGKAYRCFCTSERLAEMRKEQEARKQATGYDRFCLALTPEEIESKLKEGMPYVLRFRVPETGHTHFHDIVRGEITFENNLLDDFVIIKSDGYPTYQFANVVDDHLMEITHIIRGEEWISSAPKHLLLYQCFGWAPPVLCHLPLLRNPDKSKLSKRRNPTSVLYYRETGIVPEALLNYLGLMGYTPPSGEEMFSLGEFVETFDIRRVSLGGPIFDVAKLAWLNGRYLRERLDEKQLLERLKRWKLNDEMWARILPLAQKRIEKLSDLVPLTAFFFADRPEYAPESLIPKNLDGQAVARLLKIAQWEFEKVRAWDKDALHARVAAIAEREGLKMRDAVAPFFVAMTGSASSTPLFESMQILGGDMTRRRIQYALDALAEIGFGLSNKQLKALEEHYRKAYHRE